LTLADPSGSFRRAQRPLARRPGALTPGPSPFLRPGSTFYANETVIEIENGFIYGVVRATFPLSSNSPCSSAQTDDQPECFTSHPPRIFASFDRQ
jgi:hypothetical protein